MECLGSDYERPWSKLSETGPNSKMTKSLVVEVVPMTTALPYDAGNYAKQAFSDKRMIL